RAAPAFASARAGAWWESVTLDVTALAAPNPTSATAAVANLAPVYLMWAAQVYAVAAPLSMATPTATPSPTATPTPTPLPPAPPPAIPEADVLALFGTGLAGLGG